MHNYKECIKKFPYEIKSKQGFRIKSIFPYKNEISFSWYELTEICLGWKVEPIIQTIQNKMFLPDLCKNYHEETLMLSYKLVVVRYGSFPERKTMKVLDSMQPKNY